MIWLSPNEGHLRQTNAMIRLLRINPVSVRDTCVLCHEEFPKMHKIPRGTFKNTQNITRNCQIWTKSHEEVPKCTKSHEELPKNIPRGNPVMHKIL